MVQAKRLLEKYDLEDIYYALELYKDKMYSLGYLNERNMNEAIYKRTVEVQKEQMKELSQSRDKESVEQLAKRNKDKLERISCKSRFGTQYSFDMLKDSE